MRTVKLIIAFNGTGFNGWQSQRNDHTVQEALEKAILKIFQTKIHVTSSSRTDSGVHARGLAAHFAVDTHLPDVKITKALNFHLPDSVAVLSAKTMPDDFHAQKNAKNKIYEYRIWNSYTRPIFEAPFVLWFKQSLDVGAMKKAARFLKGRHDFSAFQSYQDDRETSVRTLEKITVSKHDEEIRIRVKGDGFLRYMVRIMVGTLMDVGRKKIKPADVKAILQSRDRKKAGPTSRAMGLTLVKVNY